MRYFRAVTSTTQLANEPKTQIHPVLTSTPCSTKVLSHIYTTLNPAMQRTLALDNRSAPSLTRFDPLQQHRHHRCQHVTQSAAGAAGSPSNGQEGSGSEGPAAASTSNGVSDAARRSSSQAARGSGEGKGASSAEDITVRCEELSTLYSSESSLHRGPSRPHTQPSV